jgi:hypothetical protein
MPAEVSHIIAADGSGDYTTISAWNSAQARDLKASDEIAVALIRGSINLGADRQIIAPGVWDTDETRKIIIRAESGQEANGRWAGEGFAKIIGSRTDALLELNVPYTEIQDICVINERESSGGHAVWLGGPHSKAVRCVGVVYSNRDNDNQSAAFRLDFSAGTSAIFCLAVHLGTGNNYLFIGHNSSFGGHKYINCAALNNSVSKGFGFNTGTTNQSLYPTVMNCVSYGGLVPFNELSGSNRWHADSRNNAGQGSDAAEIPGTNSVTSITEADIDPDTGFSIVGGKLHDAGYDHGFGTTDILGETITEWSIGVAAVVDDSARLVITGTARPGATLGVDFVNFDGIPATVTVTDSADNELVIDVDEDNGDYSITLPSLPAVSTNSPGLLFGDITISATDPGE